MDDDDIGSDEILPISVGALALTVLLVRLLAWLVKG